MGSDRGQVPEGRVERLVPLVGLAGQTAGGAVLAALRDRRAGDNSATTEFHARTAERYAARLGRSRGVLMKAGQLLSFITLDSVLDDQYRGFYQQAFARLQDDAPPMPPELAVRTVEAELGGPVRERFTAFDAKPMAAASIGQVHAATLPGGRRVAVKVQYPGVEQAIRSDLENTELLATVVQLAKGLLPADLKLDPDAMAAEITARIGEEIDYTVEAANQREFADRYRGHPFIRIPEVHPELSTRRLLTMDLAEGLRYADALRAEQALRDRWGEVLYRFASTNLRGEGLANTDPHPGNYLFHPDGSVTFLDFGCVKRFTADELVKIQAVTKRIRVGDRDGFAQAMIDAGFVDPEDPPDPDELFAWVSETSRPLLAPQPFTFTREFAAEVTRGQYALNGKFSRVVRRLAANSYYLFLSRVDLGLTAMLAALNATGPWRAISDEAEPGAPAATRFGELEREFRVRGTT